MSSENQAPTPKAEESSAPAVVPTEATPALSTEKSQEEPKPDQKPEGGNQERTAPRKPGEVDVTPGPQTAFLGGIPARATNAGLKKFLEDKFGPIEALRIITDKNTGRSKGYAFAQFKEEKDAAACKAEGLLTFLDKNINVGEAFKGTSKGSSRQHTKPRANHQQEYYAGQDYSMPQLNPFNPYQISALAQQPQLAAQLQMQAAAAAMFNPALYYSQMGAYTSPYLGAAGAGTQDIQGLLQGQAAAGGQLGQKELQAMLQMGAGAGAGTA